MQTDFAHLEALRKEVALVPTQPGCYLWKDAAGKVIYVGKAKNLRARMRQYIQLSDDRAKIPWLMTEAQSFEVIVVDSEREALVLERRLIAKWKPRFNVDFKDDKSYPYIALSVSELYPAISYTREHHRKGVRYFGPYTDARSARRSIDTLRKVVPVCTASCAEYKRVMRLIKGAKLDPKLSDDERDQALRKLLQGRSRPCFDAVIGKAPGVCTGSITPREYAVGVADIEDFLKGKHQKIRLELKSRIREAACTLDFEAAQRLKLRLESLSAVKVGKTLEYTGRQNDFDVIGISREETLSCACVCIVREGSVIRTVECILDKGMNISLDELVSGFVKRYYETNSDIPPVVELPLELSDTRTIEAWLCDLRAARVHLHVPQRGERVHLMETAEKNARHGLLQYVHKSGYATERINLALAELESALGLDGPPMRIECVDISTLHGTNTVASLVVFIGGRSKKTLYRRYKIRQKLSEANDVECMKELMRRRFAPERLKDEKFGPPPDLLIVDGGVPQLNAVSSVLDELGVTCELCGLAKADEEVFVRWSKDPVMLPSGSASLFLIKQVRDESHRFAIAYHRKLRGKAMTASAGNITSAGPGTSGRDATAEQT